MTEFNNGGYLPSSGRWSKPVDKARTAKPEKVLTDEEWTALMKKTDACTCSPEEFEGELIHWSSCPKNDGGCKDGSCSL